MLLYAFQFLPSIDSRVGDHKPYHMQSGRSPKVVALFSAANFSRYMEELLQLHDTIQFNEIMHESNII